jgi:hypothetical protein
MTDEPLRALAWTVLQDADERRRAAAAHVKACRYDPGVDSPQYQEALEAWADALAIWRDVWALAAELEAAPPASGADAGETLKITLNSSM